MNIVKSLFGWLTGDQFIMYMGGGGSGGGPNTTYSQTSNIPEYAQPYVEQMLGAGQKEIFNTDAAGNPTGIKPYQPFSNDPNYTLLGFPQCNNKRNNKRRICRSLLKRAWLLE
jgi:hypothetical protein